MVTPGPHVMKRYSGRVLSVKGIEEGRAFLREVMSEVKQGNIARQDLEKIGPAAIQFADTLTPIRTGRLVSNNKWKMVGNFKLVLYNETPYAYWVHNGTSRMEPRPFMEQAALAIKQQFPELYVHDTKDFTRRLLAKYNRQQ